MRFTVFFESPYWVGVLEEERDGLLFAAKHTFGAEPSDQEIYEFVRRDMLNLQARMTVGIPIEESSSERRTNPKRVQREIRQAVLEQGVLSKAQEAMRLQIEQNKIERKADSKAERDAERERKRELARAKAKAKHRGH